MPIDTHSELSEAQAVLMGVSRDFALSRLAPGAADRDRCGNFSVDLYKEAGELGLLGVNLPLRIGGGNLGMFEAALVIEQFARVDGSFALTALASTALTAGHLFRVCSEEQAKRWISPLIRGELGAWALTEASGGCDAAAIQCRAERCGEGYIINGAKKFVTHGNLFSVMVLMARTREGKGGISSFAIGAGDGGRESRPIQGKLGMRSCDTAEVVFEGCEIPGDRLLGMEGDGFSQAMATLVEARIASAALCVGLGQGALDAALNYAREREAFGRPIGEFGGIREQLADSAIGLAAGRELVFRAARLFDSGEDATDSAARAKLFTSEAALRSCDQGIQIHGGYGYTDEVPAHRFWRDARLLTISEGTSEILREIVAHSVFA